MRRVLVVKTGSTLPPIRSQRGDFEEWIARGMHLGSERIDVACVHEGDPLPDPGAPAGVVVTGSPAMVSERAPWSERTALWLAQAVRAETPLLGICYGHQLLAHGLGGHVGVNPRGREIGTVRLELAPEAGADPLLGGLEPATPVHATHVESVLELPRGARVLAASSGDPHQAFAVGRCAWGVQFHPEFDADVMRRYVDARRGILAEEGLDPATIRAGVLDTPASAALLARFASLLAD